MTEESMIERVARAIMSHVEDDGHGPRSQWQDFEEAARAAIEAMRESNPAMASAGMHSLSEMPNDCSWPGLVREAQKVWTAMIDAALA